MVIVSAPPQVALHDRERGPAAFLLRGNLRAPRLGEQERSRYMSEVSGGYSSINTCVPASTRSKRSMTSAFLIRMQPWECVFRSKVISDSGGK